jgi:hypothetical protein
MALAYPLAYYDTATIMAAKSLSKKHNDTLHNDTLHNDTQHNDTLHKGIICDIQYNNYWHNDT